MPVAPPSRFAREVAMWLPCTIRSYRALEGDPDGESTRHGLPDGSPHGGASGPSFADLVQVAVGGVDGSAGVSAWCRRRRISSAAEAASTRAAALIATHTQSEVPPEALLPTVARPAASGAAVCVGHGAPVAAGRCGSGWSGVPPGLGRAAMPSEFRRPRRSVGRSIGVRVSGVWTCRALLCRADACRGREAGANRVVGRRVPVSLAEGRSRVLC
jgi:hypothetical protein